MARPVVLSNGELHVGINMYGLVHDFYYPYVGLENHTIGKGLRHRVGVWIDGQISWLDDGGWDVQFSYPHMALIGHTRARNDMLGVLLEFDDTVDSDMSAFIRSVHVINMHDQPREIRLFMHQAFVIGDSRGNTDTAQYLPDNEAIVHYRGRRVFVISGTHNGKPFDQHSIGLFGIEGREGTWRDAEDGELTPGMVEHGRVDSTVRFCLDVPAHGSQRVNYSIAAGTSLREALYVQKKLNEDGHSARLHNTAQWWHRWLEPTIAIADQLPRERRQQFIHSAMIIRSHIDKRGAVMASTDSGMLNYSRDGYAYSWPRDGAYVLWPLIRLGYTDEPLRFFDFCRRGLHSSGYLSHKYRADGAIGSSWHPYVHANGDVGAPLQEDETALVLFVFAQYYHLHASDKLLAEYYDSFVKPMARWLASYVDPHTHLPRPSYDLWEQHYMVTTYSTSVTYAALLAAADLAEAAHDNDHAVSWRSVADDMRQAAHKQLYSLERGCMRKGLRTTQNGGYTPDDTLDVSAVFGSFMYGLFAADSREMTTSIETIRSRFEQDKNIALPRYENDDYYRDQGELLSNYWHITTLWHAQYCLETGDFDRAERGLAWVDEHSYPTGVLSEQIVPKTGLSTSVAPLAWSQAEYMATLLDWLGGEPA